MKLLLKDIKTAETALSKIMMTPIEFKLSYRISRVMNKLVSEIKEIEDYRLKMVEKFGEKEKDKDGKETGRLSVPPEKYEDFNKEFTVYLDGEVEIDTHPISYELLENSGVKLSPADLITLEKFIAEPVVPKQ